MRRGLRFGAAALAVIAFAPVAGIAPAMAQKLPWADANPLDRLFGKPSPRKQPNRQHQGKRLVPAKAATSTGAPVRGKRPEVPVGAKNDKADTRDTSAAAKPTDTVTTPAVPKAETVPIPQPAPAAARPERPAAAKAANDSAVAAGAAAAAAPSVTPAATPEKPADPAATADKPVNEIPVPRARPDEIAEPSPPPTPPAPAVDTAPPPPAPAPADKAEDSAPNSTDKLKSRIPTVSPAASVLAAAAVEDAEACEAELNKRGVEFTVEDSISEGECGVLRPVHVTRLASGVKVSPKTQMLCRSALALDDWMTAGVVPAAKADLPDRQLTEFRHASTYVCRPRASEKGISEHARGSAIDIAAFVFDKGEEIGVAAKPAGTPEARFQDEIRAAACGPFKTVLGPGTDSDHTTHFHLDIAARNNGATYCK